MTISQSLSNALSGLTAASRMAEVVSANLANALTEGYGRRTVELSAMITGGSGGGVRVDGIVRIVDRGVLADRRLAESTLARHETTAAAFGRVETALGPAGSADSIAGRIVAFESALAAASVDPSSGLALGRVGDSLKSLASGIRDAARTIQSERLQADRQIADQVGLLNRSLRELEEVNAAIAVSPSGEGSPAALLDQRQQIVDRIARIVPVREMDRSAGQIALVTTGGEVLIDGPARQYGFAPVHTITPDMSFASGALSGLTRNGDPVDPVRGIGLLDGGTLGAAFRLRDESLVSAQQGLDTLTADLAARLSDPAADPTLPPGAPGLLTDAGAPHDPLDVTGLALRIDVNAAIDPARGGASWRLRDGLGATAPGPVGRSEVIDAWAAAMSRQTTLPDGSGSAAAHADRLLAEAGSDRLAAEEQLSFTRARWSAFRETELANGVDSDHEMQMLLRIEQAYAANARVISTLDDMMRTLMEI